MEKNLINNLLNSINKSIELNPNYYKSYVLKGDIFQKLKQYNESNEAYNEAIKLLPIV